MLETGKCRTFAIFFITCFVRLLTVKFDVKNNLIPTCYQCNVHLIVLFSIHISWFNVVASSLAEKETITYKGNTMYVSLHDVEAVDEKQQQTLYIDSMCPLSVTYIF